MCLTWTRLPLPLCGHLRCLPLHFTEEHPDLKLLNAAIRNCVPEHTDRAGVYSVGVDSPAMAKEMEESLGMLVPYLRTRLKNEAISLEVRPAGIYAART